MPARKLRMVRKEDEEEEEEGGREIRLSRSAGVTDEGRRPGQEVKR